MALYPKIHQLLSRLYKYDFVKDFRDTAAVPLRHAIFGKKGFYLALDIAKDLELKSGAKDAKVVFDIGAAAGDKAAVLARAFPRADIYCFEPLGEAFERLEKRMRRFGNRAKLFNFAFCDRNGKADFYVEGNPQDDIISAGSSSLVPHEKQFRQDVPRIRGTRKVMVRRLDDFFDETGLKKIDFMKADVESAEKELILGGRNALEHTDNFFVEISPLRRGPRSRDYIDVFEMLHKLGFSLAGVYEDFLFTRLIKERKAGETAT